MSLPNLQPYISPSQSMSAVQKQSASTGGVKNPVENKEDKIINKIGEIKNENN